MEASAPSDFGNQFDKVPAIKALIEYFYNCEELARYVFLLNIQEHSAISLKNVIQIIK